MNKAIEVRDIIKRYESTEALRGVSFSVESGELFGLIGPDGAGKTSLIRILMTLLLPDGGSARVLGQDVITDYGKIRRQIGYMPGRFSLYQDLTVEENLRFFARIFGTTVEENYHLIRDIYQALEPFRKRKAGNLSGGMKQKLALSCALIHRPNLLILDEPTTGVDAVSRQEFWQMLKRLQEQGITLLVSTPYMDEASLCDRVALIQEGALLQVAPPREIEQSFPWPLYAVDSDQYYQLIQDLRSHPLVHSAYPFGQTVHFAARQEIEPPDLIAYLKDKGHSAPTVAAHQAGIEDCFIELMYTPDKITSS